MVRAHNEADRQHLLELCLIDTSVIRAALREGSFATAIVRLEAMQDALVAHLLPAHASPHTPNESDYRNGRRAASTPLKSSK